VASGKRQVGSHKCLKMTTNRIKIDNELMNVNFIFEPLCQSIILSVFQSVRQSVSQSVSCSVIVTVVVIVVGVLQFPKRFAN